jgi:hypothetical protein
MSNPSINRWGLNLFWYRYWFNDKTNSLTVHQDNLFNKLILLYLHFGVLYSKNIYLSKYWYINYNINYLNLLNDSNVKYFRIIEYKNKIVNETKIYKLRNKVKNLYFSKIWILRYQRWLILNFYCFQPYNSKKSKKKFFRKNLNFYIDKHDKNTSFFKRYKLFLFMFLNNFFNKHDYLFF